MIHKSRPVISSAIFAPSRWIANDCQNLGRLGFIAVGQKAFSKFDRQSQDDHLNQGRLVEPGLKAKGKP
jgi:hypothetical protein